MEKNILQKRILQYDVSRGRIPKLETIIKHLEILKPYGLNALTLFNECVIENSVLPTAGCGNTPITKEYLQNLNSYCTANGIEFIPQFEIISHQEHLLSLPQMQEHKEIPNLFSGGLRLDSEKTKDLLKKWIAELSPFFNSEYFYCATDEGIGTGIGRSRNLAEKVGYEKMVADYLNEFNRFVKTLGKKCVIMADHIIHYPEIRDMLDPDVTIANWGYGTWTEIFEQENHNFEMHSFVTEGRNNWVIGNCMAEYITTPFQRLEENFSVLTEIGGKSKAEAFVISDWGTHENVNPYISTIIGNIYILRRLDESKYSLDDLLKDTSQLVMGKQSAKLNKALGIIFLAQKNMKYFDSKFINMNPVFSPLYCGDPDCKSIFRICACMNEKKVENLLKDARKVVKLLESLGNKGIPHPEYLDEIKALGRRFLMIAIRTKLCYLHTWHTGAIWVEKKDMVEKEKLLAEYNGMADEDIAWYMEKWDDDNLEGCREKCRSYMENAKQMTAKTVYACDNCMLYYQPHKS